MQRTWKIYLPRVYLRMLSARVPFSIWAPFFSAYAPHMSPSAPFNHTDNWCKPLPRARNIYLPIIGRRRAASVLSRVWRCSAARKTARLKRSRIRLALLVNPLARNFLVMVAARKEREKNNRSILLVSCCGVFAPCYDILPWPVLF